MNSLLFLYLNLVRGPQLAQKEYEKRVKEEKEQEEADKRNGVVKVACKKCDKEVKPSRIAPGSNGICFDCKDLEEYRAKWGTPSEPKEEEPISMKMKVFLAWQVFVMLLGLGVFLYRNLLMA